MKKTIIVALILLASIILIGCTTTKTTENTTTKTITNTVSEPTSYEIKYTTQVPIKETKTEESKTCLTKKQVLDSSKCLIIYEGQVYDMTDAKRWDCVGFQGYDCNKEHDTQTIARWSNTTTAKDTVARHYSTELC